jgi:ferredoxin
MEWGTAPNRTAWRSGPLQEKEFAMKVRIEDTCKACGLCCDTCPEVFEMGDEFATVTVGDVPAEFQEAAQQAADECPVGAIIVE